ncbi:unnamed protein product [Didymodactylos carnosus]|uniref:Tesmin/TSO1-like CXC domain-containing protein n=1 Tax=Didymodactylos carnosus TaxID=1234261 RepID=A0A815KFZ9_9BILA|nr:unnamed protein product [Didymodactylos carnosus]CAF1392768.1 unnamed protein product [Didymodactylos carnosus]CAF3983568.1 unnamed protein product [Didymodactylos carnosus]CAF4287163.1 unnamed protein product [Didymodactylos carnosus]
MKNNILYPELTDRGFEMLDGRLKIKWTSKLPIPTDPGLHTCGKCKGDCLNCSCGRNGLPCTPYCLCDKVRCSNCPVFVPEQRWFTTNMSSQAIVISRPLVTDDDGHINNYDAGADDQDDGNSFQSSDDDRKSNFDPYRLSSQNDQDEMSGSLDNEMNSAHDSEHGDDALSSFDLDESLVNFSRTQLPSALNISSTSMSSKRTRLLFSDSLETFQQQQEQEVEQQDKIIIARTSSSRKSVLKTSKGRVNIENVGSGSTYTNNSSYCNPSSVKESTSSFATSSFQATMRTAIDTLFKDVTNTRRK